MLAQFRRLDELLAQYRPLWQIQPFHWRQSCWQQRLPDLHHALQALPESQWISLQQPETKTHFLKQWIPEAEELSGLCQLPLLPRYPVHIDATLNYDVGGRKWQQIMDFSGCVSPDYNEIIEWCAGKGHLGRVLASWGATVNSIEWQQALCEEGARLAQRSNLAIRFHQADVLKQNCDHFFTPQTCAVALHACGELHHRLLQLSVKHKVQGLCLAPCCYHLIHSEQYQPFSVAAKESCLNLQKHDLKIPLRETVTAGKRIRDQRITEVVWRLAFDNLQRSIRGVDQYLPLPTIPKPLLKEQFSDFCLWAADKKQLTIPQQTDWMALEQSGYSRYQAVQQMEFVQHFFQRPLEIWLLLDKVLFLQENGFSVQAGEFCDYAVTPRNVLINAERM